MKKAAKITLITIASVIGTAAVLSCTVGGLPFRIYAEKHCTNINLTAADYPYDDVQTPEDWHTVTARGISIQMPASYKQASDTGVRRFIYRPEDESASIVIALPTEFGEMELAKPEAAEDVKSKLYAALAREFADEKGIALDDWYSYYQLMYSMSLDDCDIHSLKKGAAFGLFAYLKNETTTDDAERWNWHTKDGDGFISRMGSSDDEPEGQCNVWAELYPFDDRNTAYAVLVKTPSAEQTAQIVNSVRLTGGHYDVSTEMENQEEIPE